MPLRDASKRPRVFLCHGGEDKSLARQIATDLQTAGIETFFDEWEIRSGDSLRQKIDEGLVGCTHFIVLLTPTSIERPWVKVEMDAGFVRKVSGQARFIALRAGLEVGALPPLLQGSHSPSISEEAYSIDELVGDICEINAKPPLGPAPWATDRPFAGKTGLSAAAERVAELFVRRSEHGRANDPKLEVKELQESTGLSNAQLIDAIDELKELGMVKPKQVHNAQPFGYQSVWSQAPLFEMLDRYIMGWDTEQDALVIAARIVSDTERRGHATQEVMTDLGWTPRRINPALSYLITRDLVNASKSVHPIFVSTNVFVSPKTRGFVRDRQAGNATDSP